MPPQNPSVDYCPSCRTPLRDPTDAAARLEAAADAIRTKVAEGQRTRILPWDLLNIPEQEMWRGIAAAGMEAAAQEGRDG